MNSFFALFHLILLVVKAKEAILNRTLTEKFGEIVKTNDTIYSKYENQKLSIRSVEMDESGIHSCYEYKLEQDGVVVELNTFCYPAIVVSGIRKCSTSALYNLMIQYPKSLTSYKKENCVYQDEDPIAHYFGSLPRHIRNGEYAIDGCIDLQGNSRLRTLLNYPNTFYMVLTRDYSDWVWSAYNYWCNADYEINCKDNTKGSSTAKAGIHIRTPEILDAIVHNRTVEGKTYALTFSKDVCTFGKHRYRKAINTLWRATPVESTLIIASEDLEQNPELVWRRISTSIGLNCSHPRMQEFAHVRYNTQMEEKKGLLKATAVEKYQPGLYLVSNFTHMLPETRKVLDACWQDDCVWSSAVTKHIYTACSGGSGDENKVYTVKDIKPMSKTDQLVNVNKYHQHVVNYLDRDPSAGEYGYFSARKREQRRIVEKTPVFMASHGPANTNIAVIAEHATDFMNVYQVVSSYLGEEQRISYAWVNASNAAVTAACGLLQSAAAGIRLYVLHRPVTVRFQQSQEGKVHLVVGNDTVSCDNAAVAFHGLLYLERDLVTQLWARYERSIALQKTGNDSSSSNNTTSESKKSTKGELPRIEVDFPDWNAFALKTLDSASDDLLRHRSVTASAASLHSMTLNVESFLYSEERREVFVRLVNLLHNRTVMMDEFIHAEKLQLCFKLCMNHSVAEYFPFMRVRSIVQLAYSASEVLEKLGKIYESARWNLADILVNHRVMGATAGGVEVAEVDASTRAAQSCSMRYGKLRFLETAMDHGVALVATQSSYVRDVRQLIEYGTGIFSGAMDPQEEFRDIFSGEGACNRKVSVLNIHPVNFTAIPMRSRVWFLTTTHLAQRRSCQLRGCSQGVIVFTDPFYFLWSRLLASVGYAREDRSQALELGEARYDSAKKNIANLPSHQLHGTLHQLAKEYSLYDGIERDTVDKLQTKFPSSALQLVSFESLLANSIGEGRGVEVESKQSILEDVVRFVNVSSVYAERIQCAYDLVTTHHSVEMQEMIEFFSKHNEVLCKLNSIFAERITSAAAAFSVRRLFQSMKCNP